MADQMIRKKLKKFRADKKRRELAKEEDEYETFIIETKESKYLSELREGYIPEDYDTEVAKYHNNILTHTRDIRLLSDVIGIACDIVYREVTTYTDFGDMRVVLSKLDYKKYCALNGDYYYGKRVYPCDVVEPHSGQRLSFNISDYDVEPMVDLTDIVASGANYVEEPGYCYKAVYYEGRRLDEDDETYRTMTAESIEDSLASGMWKEIRNDYRFSCYNNDYILSDFKSSTYGFKALMDEVERAKCIAMAAMAKKA